MIKNLQANPAKRRMLIAAIVAFVAILLVVWLMSADEEQAAEERSAPPVVVSEVKAVTLRETVRGIGTLMAPEEVEISAETAGRVKAIHFTEGAVVTEGELLMELNAEKLRSQLAARQAAVRTAEVRLANARRVYERQKRLVNQDLVSEESFEAVRAEYDSAAADLERVKAEAALIEEQLEDTSIMAPFTGAIAQRLVDRGTFVSAGEPLARLYQMDPLEMSFSVPERYLGRVQEGQEITVGLAAYPNEDFSGQVSFVSPVIDRNTRTLTVKAVVPNSETRLSPGAFATAVVTIDERPDRPVVPDEALVGTRTGYIVFVVADGVAKSREVSTGLRRDGLVEITEGLDVGEQVIRSGHMRVDDGMSVTVEDNLSADDDS